MTTNLNELSSLVKVFPATDSGFDQTNVLVNESEGIRWVAVEQEGYVVYLSREVVEYIRNLSI